MLNWLANLWKAKPKPVERRWLSYEDGIAGGLAVPTHAGIHVDERSALGLSGVWCAVSTISSLVSGLPLNLYQHLQAGGKREATEHPLYPLLHDSPCPELSKESYWQATMGHVLLHGNSYSEIERDGSGRPVAMWLLPPECVRPIRDPEMGLLYEVKAGNGKDVYLAAEDCFHVAGLSSDGITGHSPIRLARESLALTSACERFGSSFFGNAARPAGVLQSPLALSPNARENLRKSWESLHAGSGNTGRTAILEEGVSFSPLSIPNDDAQFLETRGYQLVEVARLFNISPVFLHDLGRATWSNLETLNRQLVQITLMPWLNKIEAQVKLKLLSKDERCCYFAEHDVDSLLRADTKTRYDSYSVAISAGWMLRSEARAAERLDPIEGLDTPTLPLNVGTNEEEGGADGAESDSEPAQPDAA